MSTLPTPPDSVDLNRLRRQVDDLEKALEAIRSGDVDALVVGTSGRVQLYSRTSADRPYKVLIEEMAAAVATVSAAGRILFANQRLAEWLRCERGSLIGRPLQELVQASDQPALAQLLAESAAGALARPLALRRSDGAGLPVLAALAAVTIEAEPVHCLVAIADSRAAPPDARLSSEGTSPASGAGAERPPAAPGGDGPGSQRRRLALLWALLLVMFLLDVVLSREIVLLPYYWIPVLLAAASASQRQLRPLALASLGLALLMGLRWSLLANTDYWLPFGAMGLVVLASLNMAGQRQRVEQRRLDSERCYQLLAEKASDVVFLANLAGVTEWISAAVTPLLGWAPEQLIGLPFGPFVHPDDLALLQKVDDAFARGERQQVRLRVRQAQGGYRWVEVTGRGAQDASGRVLGIVGSWRDAQLDLDQTRA